MVNMMKKIPVEYLGGLIDAEGTTTLSVENCPSNKYKLKLRPYISISLLGNKDYLAGEFDGDGSAQIRVENSTLSKFGIYISPLINIRNEHKVFLDLIKENFGGTVRESGKTLIWSVSSHEDVRRIIDILKDSVILKSKEIEILDEALSLIESGEHKTVEGMFYLLKLSEDLSKFHTKGPVRRDWLKVFKEIIGEDEFTRLEKLYLGVMESVV